MFLNNRLRALLTPRVTESTPKVTESVWIDVNLGIYALFKTF